MVVICIVQQDTRSQCASALRDVADTLDNPYPQGLYVTEKVSAIFVPDAKMIHESLFAVSDVVFESLVDMGKIVQDT